MSIQETQEEIITEFNMCDSWTDKYALLIDYGNDLPPFPISERVNKNLLDGCQSKLWLYMETIDGKIIYHGDSDAILVKGLVALLMCVLSNHTAQEIISADIYFLDRIELRQHLSPSRSTGLDAMLNKMLSFAREQAS